MPTPKGRTFVDGVEDPKGGRAAVERKTQISKAQDEGKMKVTVKIVSESDREIVHDVQI